ncbi:hypothetical protein ASNO1_29740 [Corallococcus caeni]|uniref:Kelch-like protein n=1 Tax=Corallococcus caeni TaxID=3082388 RepID=A0ABQ6QSR3_9BACT|nr:hypothetical protein ASNO1_29740 [Corallococcus sp. NO1]
MLALLLLAAANPLGCDLEPKDPIPQSQTQASLAAEAMNSPRSSFTLTALPDGRALAVGGLDNASTRLASCDLYSPESGWSATGPLFTARYGHAAVLLQDGRVMVLGGSNTSALSSVEFYDPVAGTWSAGPDMPFTVASPKAALLPDGKVFVVAGGTRALLFDPSAAAWTVLPERTYGHSLPVVTVLLDGRVLVSGDPGAELFDFASGSWTRPVPVVTPSRTAHAATRLADGRVLFTGGYNYSPPFLATASIFDPATNTEVATGSMSVPRTGHAMQSLPDGSVLVLGGSPASTVLTNSVERYDPVTGTFSTRVALNLGRQYHQVARLASGKLLVAGGSVAGQSVPVTTAQTEVYDPAACYTSCEQLGKNCGSIGDGCGATFECGTCSGGATCNANVCGDITAPAVTITSPTPNEFIYNTITFSANATDATGVTRVEFYVDPVLFGEPAKLLGTVTGPGPTYSVSWDSRNTYALTLRVKAYDAAGNVGSATVPVTWRNGSPVQATYDSTRTTLVCESRSSSCYSGTQFNGRGALGPEPHAPNSLRNACYDSQEGTYHVAESLDALTVSTLDSTPLAVGRRVKIEATVWASSSYSLDNLILQRTTEVDKTSGPTWEHIATLKPTGPGQNVLSTTTILPAGSTGGAGLQAIRGVFGRNTNAVFCSPTGYYEDRDDLVFYVDSNPDTVAPTVALTAPAQGATLNGTVVFQATASDNFAVTEVGFFDNGQYLGSSLTEPFTFSWNSNTAQNGLHALTARALDLKGNVKTSAAVEVTLNNDKTPPTVAITSPAQGATVAGTVNVLVTAGDNVGVQSLGLRVDGVQRTGMSGANVTSASLPFYTQGMSNGPHTLTVEARDGAGNSTLSEPVQVTVFNDVIAPTVSIASPVNGATLSGWGSLQVNASDNVAVTKVEYFLDGVLLMTRTPPDFTGTFSTVAYNNGSYSLTAKAHDAAGNSATSAAVTVLVNNPGAAGRAAYDAALKVPRCTVESTSCDSGLLLDGRGQVGPEANTPNTLDNCTDTPTGVYHATEALDRLKVSTVDGTTLAAGKRVRVDATVWAYTAVSDVLELYSAPDANSPVWTRLASFTPGYTNPQTHSTTFVLPAGARQVIRGVFRVGGTSGPCAYSTLVDRDDLVFAVASEADGVAPTVAITAPLAGSTLTGNATVSVNAADNFGVTKVELRVDGVLASTSTLSPYSLTWDTLGVVNGSHVLTAVAYDLAGNTATSAPVTVTTSNDLTPPVVSVSVPTEGAIVRGTVTLSASATDNVAVRKVEFYVDGTLRFSTLSPPYSYAWSSLGTANGSHTVFAKAYDANNNVGTSPTVSFTTDNDMTPPTVALTAPTAGAVLTGTVTLSATATDASGIQRVDFYVDGGRVSSVTAAPFTYVLNTQPYANSGHVLKAMAYDTALNSATSQEVSVTFSNDKSPPNVWWIAPGPGSTVYGPVTLSAGASDESGVAMVRFYLNGVVLGSVTSAPYQWQWNPTGTANGTVTLWAEAVDMSGQSTFQSLTVTVSTGGGQQATFDSTLRVPRCSLRGVSCDSNTLLNGRGNLGPEPNQPNVLTACADGTGGSFHSDESLDRLKVSAVDGGTLLPGKTVRVEATVWAYSGYTSDKLDLYYSASANNPSWTYLTTLTPSGAGVQTLSATYVLPSGTNQAVRGVFRYGGSSGTCPGGSYTDVDDLAFVTQ